jgi:hypothetical protein
MTYVRKIVDPEILATEANRSSELLSDPEFKRAADRLNRRLKGDSLDPPDWDVM